ncbi:MAG: pyruvate, phosphate dikinase [Thermoleophilia bacterium]|nr:pyruvate, phosphate dikinase [Thermoleophilia bacterium]
MSKKYVYDFSEGSREMKDLLGGKGANLAEMTNLGIPVPDGFTITTEACIEYGQLGNRFPEGLKEEVDGYLAGLEGKTGKKLGDPENPLLVSVRSGAKFSMPGMMDTVLNLGLNDDSVKGLAKKTGDERFAYDAYRRFIQMFGKVVMEIEGHLFEDVLTEAREKAGVNFDSELTPEQLKAVEEKFKSILEKETGRSFPADPREQLDLAIQAVFRSWGNPRAVTYRRHYNISDDLGTAVNVQLMVFGNMGDNSGTGVAFTRNPSTGEKEIFGDYLTNAQGEDVVAGIRKTKKLADMEQEMPEVFRQLVDTMRKLEQHYREMEDIEFTIEKGKFYMLQTRDGKRTAAAAVKIASDLVEEGLITKEEAVAKVDPGQLDQLLHPMIDPDAEFEVLTTGLNASPGAAVGKVVFDADTAEEKGKAGESVILVRWETSPDDIHGLIMAQGVLTSHGGMTSHAAVVARGMGKPAVCGAEQIHIDDKEKRFSVNGTVVREGDIISIDGTTGKVIQGAVDLVPQQINENFQAIVAWADEIRKLSVRTNADTPEDAIKAREFGAQGIGLCRTEHMFMQEDRLPIVRQMIMSESSEERKSFLDKLLPVQQADFEGIFEAMHGLPVTIRLLDPPLHEFLPDYTEVMVDLERARLTGAPAVEITEKEKLAGRVRALKEMNPMLGTRGCRLGIQWPEIYEMQVRAIMRAAVEVSKKSGDDPQVEIMIPLVGYAEELHMMRELAVKTCDEVLVRAGVKIEYLVGTMIELPRAALTAGHISDYADFFSFGTNDLTQTTLGFSRDDAEGKFLTFYLEEGIVKYNPFETIDINGVGRLVELAVKESRQKKPGIKLGVCGEHGGEPASVKFCHRVGLDYVSCSPFRVPLARLAAAQAVLEEKKMMYTTA